MKPPRTYKDHRCRLEMQILRYQAHRALDTLYIEGSLSRRRAYELLARKLKISLGYCHMGNLPPKKLEEIPTICHLILIETMERLSK